MIAPQVSFASVALVHGASTGSSPYKAVTPVANTERPSPDSYLRHSLQSEKHPDRSADEPEDEGGGNERVGVRTGLQLADLGGTRLSILHDDDANRFDYRSVSEESGEIER